MYIYICVCVCVCVCVYKPVGTRYDRISLFKTEFNMFEFRVFLLLDYWTYRDQRALSTLLFTYC